MTFCVSRVSPILLIALVAFAQPQQASAAETITATAHVKSAAGVEASAPVRVAIDRFSTDSERDALLAALKKGGTPAARQLLGKNNQIGSVQVGKTTVPIKYVYARSMGGGRLITVVTDSPIAYIGAGAPAAAPKAGFDLGLLMLEVSASGPGKGEMVPAAKVKQNDQGAIVTEDYSAETVQLSNVTAK
jgi:hypothetical protein